MKISVICVYNNEKQLNNQLLASLENQQISYEFIGINNVESKFSSAAKALNHGASVASGDILIFSHQDVCLKTENELFNFADFIIKSANGTVVGVAGAVEKNKTNIGNYTSGIEINEEQIYKFNSPVEVSCLDECFFGMSRTTYEMHHFDEILCDNWHLYAVELCLYHRSAGDKIYAYPCQVHHLSKGKISLSYMDGLVKLSDRYSKDFKYIWTTCYKVKCSKGYCRLLRVVWLINRKIRRKGY